MTCVGDLTSRQVRQITLTEIDRPTGENENPQPIRFKAPTKDYHCWRWYAENYGVDPRQFVFVFKEKRNPYSSRLPPLRMWQEIHVYPYRSEEGVRDILEAEAEKIARRDKLKKWFLGLKDSNPKMTEILKRLWEIGERIRILHGLKAECRDDNPLDDEPSEEYFKYGFQHCDRCIAWTKEQNDLRGERTRLFSELEKIAGKSKTTIQRVRRYIREDEQRERKDAKETESSA